MNLLLLSPDDLRADGSAVVEDRRLQHMLQVQRVEPGQQLRAGLLGGLMGQATVQQLDSHQAHLTLLLDQPPPAKLPLTLVLALPRPKMLKRTLQTIAAMGVQRLVLVNSFRVEKSFWQTPWLQEDSIREQLLLGLEQACDTVLPEVILEKRFKPFVEDRLPALAAANLKLVAHPGEHPECPRALGEQPLTLAIGPEGGWIPYEVELLRKADFAPVQLGPRILRVETAVPALIARLY
ncbi:16S rRNA (uracil(1498)-N(3))-methyltransferase [Thiopseudomonas denitrificans]|uniref:Ribosomal RNA small subunit methyltransferase E n=1 Tax=Thiopseudomonas denitrificans TaxID=1501432 RepID=A0A4R6TS62_9GAMM|nr:16S rRNA (uracil(1498)-N(3))-methyltransferase [Thiopseudomonas denitrificans]TDQ35317.1 RsmE family RNA methyltransferase [Thiopseudomonas denitrificans]